MRERARRLMSATEFLAWDDGTDTRYELIDGVPVAMAPGGVNHAQIAANVQRLADRCGSRSPAMPGRAGWRSTPERRSAGSGLHPDVLVTCEPVEAKHLYEAARLVVEVLSPSTESYDKRFKLPRYADLPSIEEIWLVDSRVPAGPGVAADRRKMAGRPAPDRPRHLHEPRPRCRGLARRGLRLDHA